MEGLTQQANQDVGQQDLDAQANVRGITPQGANSDKAVSQGSSGEGPIQQASKGRVMTAQDSSDSNGQGASSFSKSLANQASESSVILPQGSSASSDQGMTPQGFESNTDRGSDSEAKPLSFGGQASIPNAQDLSAEGSEVKPDIQLPNANIPLATQAMTSAGQRFNPDPNGWSQERPSCLLHLGRSSSVAQQWQYRTQHRKCNHIKWEASLSFQIRRFQGRRKNRSTWRPSRHYCRYTDFVSFRHSPCER